MSNYFSTTTYQGWTSSLLIVSHEHFLLARCLYGSLIFYVCLVLTRGKTAEVLLLDDSSCTAWPTFGDSASCGTWPITLFRWFLNVFFQNVQWIFCGFKMYSTGWTKSRRALDCFFTIRLWLKFRDGILTNAGSFRWENYSTFITGPNRPWPATATFNVILHTFRLPEFVQETLYCESGWSVPARTSAPKLSLSLDNWFCCEIDL